MASYAGGLLRLSECLYGDLAPTRMRFAPLLRRCSGDRAVDFCSLSSCRRRMDRSIDEPDRSCARRRALSSAIGGSLLLVARMVLRHDGHSARSLGGLEVVRSGTFDQTAKNKLSAMGAWTVAAWRRWPCLH